MSQIAKVVDITESFIPVDPNAFPNNLLGTMSEDSPFKSIPVLAYEGYNFMPTGHGYKSFFGQEAILGIDALESRVDDVFIIQKRDYNNKLVALCEDGIWTKDAGSSGAWTQEISLTIPDEGMHYNWTKTTINGNVYVYRAGSPVYWLADKNPYYYDNVASAIAGLTASPVLAGTASVPAGTYVFKVAHFDSLGRLSEPTSQVSATLSGTGTVHLSWTKLTAATGGYRIYRINGSTVTHQDIAQIASGTLVTWDYVGQTLTAGTLPDTSVQVAEYESFEFQPITPTFLNMSGQQGIFRAGIKLGFWDSDNSFSRSNLDDFSDFVPSIETDAANVIFSEVIGSVVNVLPHGSGFIIYATKSIVAVLIDESATFDWKPKPIISGSGIVYMQQATSGIHDTKHFAFTDVGIFKIEDYKAEEIVPEVFDFLKASQDPVFLRVLQGRYLCFQIIDPDYINGLIQQSVNTIPAQTISLSNGYNTPLIETEDITVSGAKICSVVGGISEGANTDMQTNAAADHVIANNGFPKKAGTFYRPIWTCYISNNGVNDPDEMTFGAGVCPTTDPNGTELNMAPVSGKGSIGSMTYDAVSGNDAFLDGNWTMERFIQVQMAIWKIQDKKREATINKILARSGSGTKSTSTNTCAAAGPTVATCDLGSWIAGATKPTFNYSECSFWLTRIIDKVVDITRVKTSTTTCETNASIEPTVTGWFMWSNPNPALNPRYPTAQEAVNNFSAGGTYTITKKYYGVAYSPGGVMYAANIASDLTCPANYTLNAGTESCTPDHTYTKVERVTAYNRGQTRMGAFAIEQPYCTITGWKYTDSNNVERTISATTCAIPNLPDGTNPGPKGNAINSIPISDEDGSYCSNAFENTLDIPDIGAITWPPVEVTLPGTSFLLQDGSIGPIYPDFTGMLVYDMSLKKWGKMKGAYKQLLDYSPLNVTTEEIVEYENFGILGGTVQADGTITLFDQYPADSYIKYGKIGYYRLGMTHAHEIRLGFKEPFSGYIETETSLDGRSPEAMLSTSTIVEDAISAIHYPDVVGRWHNISIRGTYDITHLEFRGTTSGRR